MEKIMSPNNPTKTELQEWIDYCESVEVMDGFVRVWTDQSHGYYADIWPNGDYQLSIDEGIFKDVDTVKEFIPNVIHGYDGPIEEIRNRLNIQ